MLHQNLRFGLNSPILGLLPLLDLRRDIFDRPIVIEPLRAQDATGDLAHDIVEVAAVADVAAFAGRLAVGNPGGGRGEALQARRADDLAADVGRRYQMSFELDAAREAALARLAGADVALVHGVPEPLDIHFGRDQRVRRHVDDVLVRRGRVGVGGAVAWWDHLGRVGRWGCFGFVHRRHLAVLVGRWAAGVVDRGEPSVNSPGGRGGLWFFVLQWYFPGIL